MILFLGFLFMISFIAVHIASTGPMWTLINMPSALLILVPLLFFLIVSKNGKSICKYITSSFKKNYTYTKTELEELFLAVKNTIKFTFAAGGFSFITFVVISLGNIGSPENLGPNLAISLISLVYAVAVSFFIFFPLQAWAENKILKDFSN